MRQKSLLLLLAAAATASAQTRITNWEEQHQRFVRQAAFEDLLSWFRQRCVDAGGFVAPGLSQRPGGIRNVFLPGGAKSGDALLRIPRQCLLSHKETRGYLKEYNLQGAFEKCSSNECAATEPLREPHATSVWLMNGDLSITYGPHRTQEDLFVEYGFAIDCSTDSTQCREVATVPYDGA